jgi:hypothetical protein
VDPIVSLNTNRECRVQGQTRRVLVAQNGRVHRTLLYSAR